MIGDYISYTTPTTKDTRRVDWKKLNFGGTIDWAVDLQSFTADDMDAPPDRPQSGEGCTSGEDTTVDSGDLCEFSCALGFCPQSLCTCTDMGPLEPLPNGVPTPKLIAWDELDVDMNRLCKFACKYGYCPQEICTTPEVDPGNPFGDDIISTHDIRDGNFQKCVIYKNPKYREASINDCRAICKPQTDEAIKEGRTTNYGCLGFFPLDKAIPWSKEPGTSLVSVPGKCLCDNWLINEFADTIIEAMPAIAQVCLLFIGAQKKTYLLTVPDWLLYPHVLSQTRTRCRRELPSWGR
jgi:hypothetical protein